MTNYTRIILGVIFLGCLVGIYLFFKSYEKQLLTENFRLKELESLSLSSASQAISKLTQLNDEDRLSLEEKIFLLELQFDHPEILVNSKLLELLSKSEPGNPDVLVLQTCHLLRESNSSALLQELGELADQFPGNLRARYEYQKRTFILGKIEDRLFAKKQLYDLARRTGRWGYKALQVLCFSPPLRGYLKEDLLASIDLLHAHPLVTSIDYLKGCELKMILNENYKVNEFVAEIDRLVGTRVKSLDYATWLLKLGQPQKVLSLISEEITREDSASFFIRFMALLETKNNESAKSLLEMSRPMLSQDEIDRADAYLKIAQGDVAALQKMLKNLDSKSPVHLLALSRLALFKGLADAAMMAFDRAWEISPDEFSLSQANQYIQLSLAAKQTVKAHSITKNLNYRYPYKYGNTNNFCYLSLLLGIKPTQVLDQLHSTIRAVPNNPAFLSTLALANLLSGNPEEALKDMQKRDIPQLVPSERAILAVIFHQLRDREKAEKMAASIPIQRLLPEELKLLQDHNLIAIQ